MNQIYDKEYIALLHKVAEENQIDLKDGVYLQVTGPAFESPAESRMFASFGADAVGMSTTCEAIMLKYMSIRILGISCITDMAIDNEGIDVTHEEVQAQALRASGQLKLLIRNVIKEM
jgi:purine-nucleoside phosphorylase